jgi:alkanesulfonate monooxygenase SsuD/methylene tetrahydromethanopterin reductase-like flavin-dependent oxidoreductase (luciferase family)
MWAGDARPFEGRNYRLEQPLNVPNALRRPRPPILVGGSGERNALRLVARYGDAGNLFELGGLPAGPGGPLSRAAETRLPARPRRGLMAP